MNNFIEIDSNYREINSKLMELAGNAKNIKPQACCHASAGWRAGTQRLENKASSHPGKRIQG